jgi:hypothetical protein
VNSSTSNEKHGATASAAPSGSPAASLTPVDREITVTMFPSLAAKSKRERKPPMSEFERMVVEAPSYSSKAAMPLIKLATFGEQRTAKGSLRSNPNMPEIDGVEGDYDGKRRPDGSCITIDEAAALCKQAGIAAMFASTPSSTPEVPKWRVFTFTSRTLPAGGRDALAEKLGALFGGLLDVGASSANRSQTFYFGRLEGAPYETRKVAGGFIDEVFANVEAPESGDAFGAELGLHDATGAQYAPGGVEEALAIIAQGDDGTVHRALLSYIAKRIARGDDPDEVRADAEQAIHDSPLGGTARGAARIAELDRMVEGARAKFTRERVDAVDEFEPLPVARKDHRDVSEFVATPDGAFLDCATNSHASATALNARCRWPNVNGAPQAPAVWVRRNRAIDGRTWIPGEPAIIEGIAVDESGPRVAPGVRLLNTYRPPVMLPGDPSQAGPWIDHVRTLYPEEADHLIRWLAHRAQRPAEKLNHAIVAGGATRIGKDTLLAPVVTAVGATNVGEIGPADLFANFNPWARSVLLRVSEVRDFGGDKFKLYERCKTLLAAPPETLTINEKNVPQYPIPNVVGVVFTTNYLRGGLYLPADDARHCVLWSEVTRERLLQEKGADYFDRLYRWLDRGGRGHVAAFLRSIDLSGFNAKAPAPRTAAFADMVDDHMPSEVPDLLDVVDRAVEARGGAADAFFADELSAAALALGFDSLALDLVDRTKGRRTAHLLADAGLVRVPNPSSDQGLWTRWESVGGKRRQRRVSVYARSSLARDSRVAAAQALIDSTRGAA